MVIGERELNCEAQQKKVDEDRADARGMWMDVENSSGRGQEVLQVQSGRGALCIRNRARHLLLRTRKLSAEGSPRSLLSLGRDVTREVTWSARLKRPS